MRVHGWWTPRANRSRASTPPARRPASTTAPTPARRPCCAARSSAASRGGTPLRSATSDTGLLVGVLGLIGADLPEPYAGLGAPSVTAGLAIQAVAEADVNVACVPVWCTD